MRGSVRYSLIFAVYAWSICCVPCCAYARAENEGNASAHIDAHAKLVLRTSETMPRKDILPPPELFGCAETPGRPAAVTMWGVGLVPATGPSPLSGRHLFVRRRPPASCPSGSQPARLWE